MSKLGDKLPDSYPDNAAYECPSCRLPVDTESVDVKPNEEYDILHWNCTNCGAGGSDRIKPVYW